MAQPVKRIHVLPGPAELARAAAGRLWGIARDRAASGPVHIALSGGETPRRAYGALSSEPYRSGFPWEAVHFWQVDERFVPADDPRSNRRMIREELLDPVRFPPERFHWVDTALPDPAAAAAKYESELRKAFSGGSRGLPRLDAVVLGLGADGHTASLFPGGSPGASGKELALPAIGGDPPLPRVTMSPALINAAACILFLVQGERKAKALRDLAAAARDASLRAPGFPAGQVAPARGTLLILADADAARLLPPGGI
ncbi:MAG: 6-phosphogluconolactonase [Thermodesulfobacteriota bacterium]